MNHGTALISAIALSSVLATSVNAEEKERRFSLRGMVEAVKQVVPGVPQNEDRKSSTDSAVDSADDKALAKAQRADVAKAAAIGAGAGAALGAVVNHDDRSKGAKYGAVAGVVIGTGVGIRTAGKRGDYHERYTAVNEAVAAAEAALVAITRDADRVEQRIQDRRAGLEPIRGRTRVNRSATADAWREIGRVEADIETTEDAEQQANVQVRVLENELKSLNTKHEPSAAELAHRDALAGRRDDLLASLKRLNGIKGDLVAQQAALTQQAQG